MIFSIHAYWDKWTSFLFQENFSKFSGGRGRLKSMPSSSLFKMAVKREGQLDCAHAWRESASCAGNFSRVAAHQTIRFQIHFEKKSIVVISKGVFFRGVGLLRMAGKSP